ncbi:MAG: tetratricopeptide repeat protein [Bacteroidales bacterium]|nr:tetratricopeptide repeat protein [Bacteroidales bacterium]MDD3011535.1 tetratricopeptide repeat protein [Bacteroidales bacterium]MDD3961334.1 tetratricopeptide repeat protein [Bacteroidales bacterium]HPE86718.1 tetratricopeptide repeat protein [Bacteroidales bacterium]
MKSIYIFVEMKMDNTELLKHCLELEDRGAMDEIVSLIETHGLDDCEDPDMHYYYGRILKKQGKFGEALNAFNKALMFDSEHKKALAGIELVNSILNIENTLYYGNPYTDEALFDL